MGSSPFFVLVSGLLLYTITVAPYITTANSSVLDYSEDDLRSETRLLALFERWNHRHNKHYPVSASEEKEERFHVFKKNLHHIHNHNHRSVGSYYKLGLTRFADLSNEEFKSSFGFFGLRLNNSMEARKASSFWRSEHPKERAKEVCRGSKIPSSYDWRERGVVSDIKDQGSCGSCWAFATISAIESVNAIRSGELVRLSEQELVSCDRSNYGCDGGDMDLAMDWVLRNGGVNSDYNYPYTSADSETRSCQSNQLNQNVVSIDTYANVDSYDEDALLCATYQQPVIVSINAGEYDFQLYAEGIFDGKCAGEAEDLNHAVVVVGYGTSEDGLDYWIVRNSWGVGWGAEGYSYMVRSSGVKGEGVCGINSQASYPWIQKQKQKKQMQQQLSTFSTPTTWRGFTESESEAEAESPAPSPQAGGEIPPPSPSPSPPPPPSPSPPDTTCDRFFSCPPHHSCCCRFEFFGICLLWGCCDYQAAVCCDDSDSCCPLDFPICDLWEGVCLQDDSPVAFGNKVPLLKRSKAKFSNRLGFDDMLLPLADH